MKIIINTSSMVPIYEQIIDQIKTMIRKQELKQNDQLPSVRALSKELKISALTVKKAYDELEREGFTVTIHGKGSYVTAANTELMMEEQKKEVEQDLEQAILKGRRFGISDEDIKTLFELILEGSGMLKIDKLKKQYKNFTLNCSMEVKEGMITGFVGPNGSGKSTTLKAVLGLIYIDGGDIQIFGKNVKDIKPEDKEQIGVVLSDSGFSRYLTVKDIKDILKNTYEAFDEQLFTNYIEKYQLPTDKKLEQFSVGMKAKLKLITAICHKAKLLILDEPTAGLDVMARNEMLDMLRDYIEEDEERSILVSSHISTDLETLCDNIYMINEGNIILHEETDRLLSNYAILKVDEEQSKTLDPQYIIKMKKESYGYACLTDQKQFYLENYLKIVVEKGTIDQIITLMIQGV